MMVTRSYELNFGYHKTISGTSEQQNRSKWWWCVVGSKDRDSKVLNLINTEPDLSVLSIMC